MLYTLPITFSTRLDYYYNSRNECTRGGRDVNIILFRCILSRKTRVRALSPAGCLQIARVYRKVKSVHIKIIYFYENIKNRKNKK